MGNIIKDGSGSYFPMLFILPLAGLAELASLYSIQALLPKLSEVYHIPLNQVGMILSAEVGFLAFAMLFPNVPLYLMFIPIPIKAKYFVIFYGLAELFMGVANNGGDSVAHFAHLGGMLFGYFLVRYWKKKDIDNGRYFY